MTHGGAAVIGESRRDLLSPESTDHHVAHAAASFELDGEEEDAVVYLAPSPPPSISSSSPSTWRLNLSEFRLPQSSPARPHHHSSCRRLLPTPTHRKQRKIAEYYKKQERLYEGFNEMETMTESGCFPGTMTEDELKQLARSEKLAVHASNTANLVLFAA
ncbi:hypothetical protein SAY86_003924 [Trapa natans]|uniref:Uncharacterized protein n=1 Tax=Trapa natans TaxID=22666 RepID=A0AAN7RHH2_TRANT|nr:hypothetical protein SAY86_003924 [Trapa natans]